MSDDFSMRAAPLIGSLIAGKYQVVRDIGGGGMGSVVEACNTVIGKRVAVKCMRPDIAAVPGAVQRFTREARVCTSVQHPNVVEVYDVVHDGSSVFIVMELLEGESFRSFLLRDRAPIHEVVSLLIDAMRGVAAAHEHGIIHRDIKPENIFLAKQPYVAARKVKVLDFGLSKPVHDNANPMLSRTGEVMGTLDYISREQLHGVADIDTRTDVYAFGVMLYEALGGSVPYAANNVIELAAQFERSEPAPLRQLRAEVPRTLESIIARAMAKERVERTASLEDLIRELEPFAVLWHGIAVESGSGSDRTRARIRARARARSPDGGREHEHEGEHEQSALRLAIAAPASPRDSYPSLPNIDSDSFRLGMPEALDAALRSDLDVWSAGKAALWTFGGMLLAAVRLLRGIIVVSFVLPIALLTEHEEMSPSPFRRALARIEPNIFDPLIQLVSMTLQLGVRLLVLVIVLLWLCWDMLRFCLSLVFDVLDRVGRWWTAYGSLAAKTFISTRHGKHLLAVVALCIGIAVAALWGPTPEHARPARPIETPSAKARVVPSNMILAEPPPEPEPRLAEPDTEPGQDELETDPAPAPESDPEPAPNPLPHNPKPNPAPLGLDNQVDVVLTSTAPR
jgi:serine/threonine-protein kinase